MWDGLVVPPNLDANLALYPYIVPNTDDRTSVIAVQRAAYIPIIECIAALFPFFIYPNSADNNFIEVQTDNGAQATKI
ncbi:hypothetical protein [Glaciimonas sp. PCH181]|uniref:hypothetical protein n=1 Tax=Glaciimonas sp. PCH181 TaxID=2133943 RepID=UPI000D36FF76|nr:hypothetical protein [Glaciimonas sp. PCH181]PUA20363.1 hypothetical protein C7W93_11565 [Glaciimonas sp. PCH181]